MGVARRDVLKLAAVPILRLKTEATADSGGFRLQAEALDRAVLTAIAEVVLPAEADRKAAVDAFIRWVREYKEGADTDHGYGNTRVRATGPSPARHYGAQIAALESAARAANAPAFAKAPLDVRRAVIERAIADAKIERLPSRPTGGHVATDLMGHYFASSPASDLCYGVAIGRDQCRGLQGSNKAPAPLPPNRLRQGYGESAEALRAKAEGGSHGAAK
jgi:gluconate 2-dehydrogenase subunit 3-like protein